MTEEPNPPSPFPEKEGGGADRNVTGCGTTSPTLHPTDARPEGAKNAPPPSFPGKGDGGFGSSRRALHLLALLLLLSLWTWKLLEPQPVPEALAARLKGGARLAAAKGLHACGYFTLTLLAVTLPVPTRWRWAFAALLALHGVGTEVGQTYVPGRVGSARDVLIDWAGVAAAVLAWRAGPFRVSRWAV